VFSDVGRNFFWEKVGCWGAEQNCNVMRKEFFNRNMQGRSITASISFYNYAFCGALANTRHAAYAPTSGFILIEDMLHRPGET